MVRPSGEKKTFCASPERVTFVPPRMSQQRRLWKRPPVSRVRPSGESTTVSTGRSDTLSTSVSWFSVFQIFTVPSSCPCASVRKSSLNETEAERRRRFVSSGKT